MDSFCIRTIVLNSNNVRSYENFVTVVSPNMGMPKFSIFLDAESYFDHFDFLACVLHVFYRFWPSLAHMGSIIEHVLVSCYLSMDNNLDQFCQANKG